MEASDNGGDYPTDSRVYYAHSLPGRPKEEWQPLEDHLKNVAEMARGFAAEFGAGEWGEGKNRKSTERRCFV
jgi:hypothetical protein